MADSAISFADIQAVMSALQQLATVCDNHHDALNPFVGSIQSSGLLGSAGDELVQVLNKQLQSIDDFKTFSNNTIGLLSKVMSIYQDGDKAQAGQAAALA